jgi:hypothetical protein
MFADGGDEDVAPPQRLSQLFVEALTREKIVDINEQVRVTELPRQAVAHSCSGRRIVVAPIT